MNYGGGETSKGDHMNVQSILSAKGTEVATIAPQSTLAEAAATLAEKGYGALVASNDGTTIAGIISERDIVRTLSGHGAGTLDRDVASCMSADVVTCKVDDTLDELMGMMTDRRIRHLPVVDEGGTLGGMISIGDVVKQRLAELERENSQLHDYIQGNVG